MIKDKECKKFIELIPEYLGGLLGNEQKLAFEKAVNECSELQQELHEAIALKSSLRQINRNKIIPSEAIFESVLTKIEDEESETVDNKEFIKKESPLTGVIEWFKGVFSSPAVAWGVCGFQAAAIILALVLIRPDNSAMTTMSSQSPKSVATSFVYNVVFNGEKKVDELSDFLKAHNIRIVDGPLGKGRYKVASKEKLSETKLEQTDFIDFIAPAY